MVEIFSNATKHTPSDILGPRNETRMRKRKGARFPLVSNVMRA
jgi:hypothetical protein